MHPEPFLALHICQLVLKGFVLPISSQLLITVVVILCLSRVQPPTARFVLDCCHNSASARPHSFYPVGYLVRDHSGWHPESHGDFMVCAEN